jgi:hypothetical protein
MTHCSIFYCSAANSSTACLTVDLHGTQWLCNEHWKDICTLFNGVVAKCMKEDSEFGCKRNHHAEIDYRDWELSTVKYMDKCYDLCDGHFTLYDDLLGSKNIFY